MAVKWSPYEIVLMDRDHDIQNASDGYSRYGSYVGGRELSFRDHFAGNDTTPLAPNEFAAMAWEIANSPVMSPGLVRVRPDIHEVKVSPYSDGSGSEIVLTIEVPLKHNALRGRPPYEWRDWHHPWAPSETFPQYHGSEPDEQPLLLVTATLALRPRFTLIAPTATTGRALVEECLQAVSTLTDQINAVAAPMVAQLRQKEGAV